MPLQPDGRTTYKGRIYELYGDELYEVVCDFKTGLAKREMVATVGELPDRKQP